jgi:hypothetical protein
MQYLTDLLNIDYIKQELIDLREFNKELITDNEKKDKLIKALKFKNNNYIDISDNIIMTEIQCKYNFELSLDIKYLSNKNKELTDKIKELTDLDNMKQERYETLCKYNSTIIDKNKELTDKNIELKQENIELKYKINIINDKNIELKQENDRLQSSLVAFGQELKDKNIELINIIHENKELNTKLCIICYENKKNYTVIPCGHVFSCEKCIVKINKCSICRISILNKHKIFI